MRRRALVAAVAAWSLIALVLPAGAHTWQDHYRHGTYTARWDVPEIPWHFDTAYWDQGAAFRDRAREATALWSDVLTNGYVQFDEADTLGAGTYEQCTYNAGVNYLRFAQVVGPAAATWYCYRPAASGDEWSVSAFAITVDSEPAFGDGSPASWYSSTGKGGSTQVDLLSALVHEFGHAGGHAVHFDEPALCPNEAAADHTGAPTMCGGVWYGNDTNRRTLEDHDIHTMQAAYVDPPAAPTTTTTPANDVGLRPPCDVRNHTLLLSMSMFRPRCV